MLGARLGGGSSLDTSYIGVNAITNKLPDSLELFSDVLLNPTFPQADLDRLKAQSLAAIQQEKTQPQGIAMRLFPALVYGEGHAYANPFSGNGSEADRSQSCTRAPTCEAFRDRWMRPDNATHARGGRRHDREHQAAAREASRRRGKRRPSRCRRRIWPTVSAQAKPRVFLVNRTGAEQTADPGRHTRAPALGSGLRLRSRR